jgi:hypothetical protein
LPAVYFKWPEASKALAEQTVAYGSWDPRRTQLTVSIHRPVP